MKEQTGEKSDYKAHRGGKKGKVGLKSVKLNESETERKNKGKND